MSVQIRRPAKTDWPRLLALLETANFHNIGGREMPEFPLSDCFVGIAGEKIVAVCGYRILSETTAKNTLTAIHPDFRGSGLATHIKQVCVEYLIEQGIKTLFTNCDNDQVIEWNIRNFGFRRTGKLVPKVESFGRDDIDHWVSLVADLPPPGHAITHEQIHQYETDGYLHLSNRFDENEVQEWITEMSRLWNSPGLMEEESFRVQGRDKIAGGRELERIDWFLPESERFMALAGDRRIVTPVEHLLKEKPVLFKDKLIVRPPGTNGYGLHQDYPYWKDAGVPPSGLLTVGAAIDDTDHLNGMLSVFPNHHHRRLNSPLDQPLDTDLSEVDLDSEESICLKSGDLLIFNTLVPHRSAPNNSLRNRRILYLSYAAGRYGENLHERYYRFKAGEA